MSLRAPFARVGTGALIIVFALLFAGCAPSSDEGQPPIDETAATDGDEGTDDGGGDDGGDDGGAVDPEQDRIRTGPTVDYNGPDDGDQGTALIEPGVWCTTVAVFWGGDPVPEGVRFTYTEAIVDRAGLAVTANACGVDFEGTPLESCIGFVLEANAAGTCGLEVRPSDAFAEGTGITFAGTLECPSAEACVAVENRTVDPGPPIVVFTPSGTDGTG